MADRPHIISYARKLKSRRTRVGWFGGTMALLLICLLGAVGGWFYHLSNRIGCQIPPRVMCESHLHAIGLGILLFQNDHGGHYPDSMAEIVSMGLGPNQLICQDSADTPAHWAAKPTTQQAAAILAVPGHCSYVYLGHASWTDATTPGDAVVAYDPPADHQGDGSVILFADGHAEWIASPRAGRLIKAASATTRPVSAASVP